MAVKERVPLLEFARQNCICHTKAYEMAHAKKYRDSGIIRKIDGRYKVDIAAFEKMLEFESA